MIGDSSFRSASKQYWVPLGIGWHHDCISFAYSRAFLPSVVWGTVWDPAFSSLLQSFLYSLWRVPRSIPSCLEGNRNDKSPLLMAGNVAVKLAEEYLGAMWHDTERNRIEQSIVLVFQKLEHTWNQWLEFGTPRSNNWATVHSTSRNCGTGVIYIDLYMICLLYTSPSPRDA